MGKIDLSALKNLQTGASVSSAGPATEITSEPPSVEEIPATPNTGVIEVKKPKISLTAMNKPSPQSGAPSSSEPSINTVLVADPGKIQTDTGAVPVSSVLKIGDDSYETLEMLDKKKEEEIAELDRKKREEVLKDLFPDLDLLTQDFESDVFDEKNSAGLTEVFQANPNLNKDLMEEVIVTSKEIEAPEDEIETPDLETPQEIPSPEEVLQQDQPLILPVEIIPQEEVVKEKKGFFGKNTIPMVVVLLTISSIVGMFIGMSLYKKHIEESSRVIVTQTGIVQENPIPPKPEIEALTTTETINGLSVTIRQNTKKNTGMRGKNSNREVPARQ